MNRISEIIGDIFLVVFVGILFLSFGSLLYIAIIFLTGLIFGPELIRNSGMTGYVIVGLITFLILFLSIYGKIKFENIIKYNKYIFSILTITIISCVYWYFYSNKLPNYYESYDIDQNKNSFRIVKIGEQTWMAENLNVQTFRNGDTIYQAKSSKDWVLANENKKPAWCYYENDTLHYEKQGKLYNWYAIIDPRGIAPNGWRIPYREDWVNLSESLGGEAKSGILLKDISWNPIESDKQGFFSIYKFNTIDPVKLSLLPCGAINFDGYCFGMEESQNNFTQEKVNIGAFSGWWHINEGNTDFANIVYLTSGTENLFFDIVNEGEGYYVRCIKD
jgi:uncharacterized protein (TIGR02145 family)